MVFVNGKEFKLHDLDDIETFKSRLASNMETIVSFLHFSKPLSYEDLTLESGDIVVYNILQEILDSARKNSSIVELVVDVQSKIGITKLDRGKKIVKIWMAYNKTLQESYNFQGSSALDTIATELSKIGIYNIKQLLYQDWKENKSVSDNITRRILSNKDESNTTTELFKEYSDIEESAASTFFEVQRIQFVLTLSIKNQSMLEIFNAIVLNSLVPFATTQNFYKIQNNFFPSEKWTQSSDESIILQVKQKKNTSVSSDISNYENAIVKLDSITNNMKIEIAINSAKDNISREEFTDRTLSVFKTIDTSISDIIESKVTGVFYFTNRLLNKYVFADLTMNNPIFSKLMSIDEHEKATKMKSGLYIHFDHPSTGYITATLTEKKITKGDPSMKNVDKSFYDVGDIFIRVKISKANNTKSINRFIEILGKLFILYDQKIDDIVKYYKNYIPTFGNIAPPPVEVEKIQKLSDVVPDLFVPLYTRNCKQDRVPTIISEEKAMELKAEGKSVIKFPRDIPTTPDHFKFPLDGEGQHYYTCENVGYTYAGIKNNKLKNANLYPYVPCCFKLEQERKIKYQHYYEGKELIVGEKKQNNIIKTDKILKFDQFGTLPDSLEDLFTIIDPNPMHEYVRKGVHRSKNSFINVLMEALKIDLKGEINRKTILSRERINLANKNTVPLCRQELYDRTLEEIIDMIKDEETYFDPKLFIHLLEERFDCDIFLFSRQILDGEMILPRHTQAYYKNTTNRKCIYVYEHMGSESDYAKYPQCELIVKFDNEKDTVSYSFSQKKSENIRDVYASLSKSYALNTEIHEINLPILHSDIKIKSQWIDSYGKTRRLNIVYDNKNITFVISPIQPIKVKEAKNKTIHLIDIKTALKIVNTLGIKITSQTIINDKSKELNGTLGNVYISIPLNNEDIIKGIVQKDTGLSYPEKTESALTNYNKNKKMSRYLIEYTLWLYSTYLQENTGTIVNFATNFYTIKPGYNYGYIEKTFNYKSSILEEGKIVVHDEETIKRLIYVLRHNLKSDTNTVKKYYKRTNILNYYIDITDFDKYSNQIILHGEKSISKWLLQNNTSHILQDSIQIGINTPYFFKNSLVDNDNIYLAQNIQTLEKASAIATTWITEGYNIGIKAVGIPIISFILYSYVNNFNIKQGVKIKGEPFSRQLKILGYRVDNMIEYTVLLPLS